MTMEGFITGQPLNGRQLGNAIFQFMPSLPHESPIPMPRVMARALFPQGFQPFRVAAPPVQPVPLIPPAVAAPPANQVPAQPPAPTANQVVVTQPAAPAQPPQPAPRGYRPAAMGGEPISARSQRVRIHERAGM